MTKKPTNPKDAAGVRKLYMSVIPWGVMADIGIALQEGALKYGRHNFRDVGVRGSVYFDASLRHLMSWWEGEDIDGPSGVHHVSKAIAGLMVLRESMIVKNWVDDRPPRVYDAGWVDAANELAAALVDKYPEPALTHTELDNVTTLGDVMVQRKAQSVYGDCPHCYCGVNTADHRGYCSDACYQDCERMNSVSIALTKRAERYG